VTAAGPDRPPGGAAVLVVGVLVVGAEGAEGAEGVEGVEGAEGAEGAEVLRVELDHGVDPEELLDRSGLRAVRLLAILGRADPHEVELRYEVVRGGGSSGAVRRGIPSDTGLLLAPGEEPHRFQRVAVYGLVRSHRGLLLTQMSDRTNSPGAWGLAGGGLDPGELPEAALHREVWEESGQRVDRLEPLRVTTSHWVGRAPSGRAEDFHAVRVVYSAWCAEPTDPVVHDVGGTTERSAWFADDELADLPFVTSWAGVLKGLVHR